MKARRLWLALGWAIVAAIVWLSVAPSPPKLDVAFGDKLGHLAAYGVLMFWFCQLYASRAARLGYALGFAAMGVALEFVQRALGYRSFEIADMAADVLGLLLGWTLGALVCGRLFERLAALLARIRP